MDNCYITILDAKHVKSYIVIIMVNKLKKVHTTNEARITYILYKSMYITLYIDTHEDQF